MAIADKLQLVNSGFTDIRLALKERNILWGEGNIANFPSQIVSINGANGYIPPSPTASTTTAIDKANYIKNVQNIIKTSINRSGVSNFTLLEDYGDAIRAIPSAYTVPQVTNLLPQYIQANWNFDRFTIGNANYDPSNYSGESVRPTGNVVVLFPSGNYGECYIYPKEEHFPPLVLGHQYYVRWMSRKEVITNAAGTTQTTDNSGVNEDLYWPEMETAWVRGLNNSNYHLWRLNGRIITAQQSQWSSTVTNGNYKIRFDCNNNRKYVKYWCTADFMLIDLTECYTNNSLPVPSLNELQAKPYFYGSRDVSSW